MQITYGLVAMGASQLLRRDFRQLSSTTSSLLSDLGVYRAPIQPGSLSMRQLAANEGTAVTNAIAEANDTISMYQTADSALATLHGKLASMRDIVDDVAMHDYKKKELRQKDEDFQELVAEVEDLLDQTAFEGRKLLRGVDAVVTLSLDAVLEMSMTDLPDGATATMTLAMTSVTGARGELTSMTTSVRNTVADLEDHLTEISSFELRVGNAQAALEVMRSLMDDLATRVSEAMGAQANLSAGVAAWLLLA